MKRFKNIGSVGKFPELNAISDAIFHKKNEFQLPDGTPLTTKVFKNTLYAVEHKGIRYIEQNPNTNSAYAQKAKGGAQIFWVIRMSRKVIDAAGVEQYVPCAEEWLGYIEDGKVYLS